MKVVKFIEILVFIALILVNIWFISSFIDVVVHNTQFDSETVLHSWNLFQIFR